MVLQQQPWITLIFIYWLFCLILFSQKVGREVSFNLRKRTIKVFVVILGLFIGSWLIHSGIGNKNDLVGITLLLLAILFDIAGTIIFVWYGIRKGYLILGFPLLLIRYGPEGVKKFIEKYG